MNRKQRQLIIEAFRMIRIRAEEGEKFARQIVAQDIGPTADARTAAVMAVRAFAETTARASAALLKGLDDHLGANEIIDRAKYPRAKTLSSSKTKVPE